MACMTGNCCLEGWSRDTPDLSLLLCTAFKSEASVPHPPLMLERHGTVLAHPHGGELWYTKRCYLVLERES